jgi:phospholipase C
VLYSFNAGETSGSVITNKHPNGYKEILVMSSSNGILAFQPMYYISEWSSGGQTIVGSFDQNDYDVNYLECDAGGKIVGISGNIDVKNWRYPVKDLHALCDCKYSLFLI